MTPIAFPEANKTLVAKDCLDLPVFDDGQTILSMYQLTDEEKRQVAETGVISLWVWTRQGTQPPVMITAGPIAFVTGDAAEERA